MDNPAAGKTSGALPFSPYEFMIAGRYLRTKRKHGGVALIAIISFLGIMLAVTGLIAILSIMNGFRTELYNQLLGFHPHVYVDVRLMDDERVGQSVERIENIPGVVSANPVVQGQVMATTQGGEAFIQILAVAPEDFAQMAVVQATYDPTSGRGLTAGDVSEFGVGRNGGDIVILGEGVANQLRVQVGDPVTFLSARGASGPFGVTPRRKTYYVGAILKAGVSTIDNGLAILPVEQAQLFFIRLASLPFAHDLAVKHHSHTVGQRHDLIHVGFHLFVDLLLIYFHLQLIVGQLILQSFTLILLILQFTCRRPHNLIHPSLLRLCPLLSLIELSLQDVNLQLTLLQFIDIIATVLNPF